MPKDKGTDKFIKGLKGTVEKAPKAMEKSRDSGKNLGKYLYPPNKKK